MTDPTKTWHLLPVFDVAPPPDGTVRLGSIIASKTASSFHSPLNSFPYVPESLIRTFSPGATSHTVKRSNHGNLGFATKIAQLIGIGPEADVRWANSNTVQYVFDREHDVYFEPALQLVNDTVTASLPVQDYLHGTSYRKPVYMVTGIKWVEGFKMKVLKGKERGGDLKLAVDATSAGIPIGGDVHGGGSRTDEEDHAAQGGLPFIFAVRLYKITFSRMGDVKAESHTKGAFLGNKTEKDRKNEGPITMEIQQATADDFEDSETANLVEEESGSNIEFIFTEV